MIPPFKKIYVYKWFIVIQIDLALDFTGMSKWFSGNLMFKYAPLVVECQSPFRCCIRFL